jgi:hypothetical protein
MTSAVRVSRVLSVAAFGTIAGLGLAQLLKDGSFWIDEASVALSLQQLAPEALFGPLVGGQSFPRLHLLAIRGLVGLFGYETLVVRALPHLFFWLATLAWVRLLYLRFRAEPLLVALGALLLLIPAPWFVYAAMLKPYTLDVLLAAVPFLLGDDFYDATLERGESPLRLFALTALGALSYPFAMALIARCAGWWLSRAGAGRLWVSPRGALVGLLGVSVFAAALWQSDLRHTLALREGLQDFWRACLIGAEGTPTLALLDRFAFGWWDGRSDFSRGGLGAPLLLALRIGFAVGCARIALGLLRAHSGSQIPGWGSRSVGCGVLVASLPFASFSLGLPICAGRLTLFALLPLLILTLEGFAFAMERLRGGSRGGLVASALAGALVIGVAPTSLREASRRALAGAPDDLRPLLERIREDPDLPILSNACTRRQLETLPEGLGTEVLWLGEGGGVAVALREPPEAWLLFVPARECQRPIERVRERAVLFAPHHTDSDDARLYRVRFGS